MHRLKHVEATDFDVESVNKINFQKSPMFKSTLLVMELRFLM